MVAITETGFTKDGMVTLEGYKKIVSNPRLRENGKYEHTSKKTGLIPTM